MHDPKSAVGVGRLARGRWSSRAARLVDAASGTRRSAGVAAWDQACEALESRQLLSTVFAVTDANVLIQFESDAPSVIMRSTPISGLGAGQKIASLDFKPGTDGSAGTLIGVASGTRTPFYSIDPATGVATNYAPGLQGGLPLNFAVGLDYDDSTATAFPFRYVDELGGSYQFNEALNDFTNTAGISGLTDIAFRPTGGNPALRLLIGITYNDDQLVVINPINGQPIMSGALGLDVDKWVGLDFARDGTAYASVRSGGVARFGKIGADGHTFEQLGIIGDGTAIVRGMTVDPTVGGAPILNTSLLPRMDAIEEDGGGGTGTSVSALLVSAGPGLDLITDPNPAAFEGIAITGADASHGVWEYTLNGTTWASLGLVSESAALLLPANGLARVRFVPDADFNGTIAEALRFRAWDQTGANVDDRVNVGPGGGESGFSVDSVWASIEVTPTRDAPTIDRGPAATINTTEKVAVQPFAGFTIAYSDDALGVLVTTVVIDPTLGTFTASSLAASGFVGAPGPAGSSFMFTGTAAQATAAARLLEYKPHENIAPVGQSTLNILTITVADGLGAPAQALAPFISSLSTRDGPVISGVVTTPFSIDDRQTVMPFVHTVITNIDSASQMLTVEVGLPEGSGVLTDESLAASGFFAVDGLTYRFTGTAAQATDAVGLLIFRPTENTATPGTEAVVTLGLSVTDGLGPAATATSAAISVLSLNDDPTVSGFSPVSRIKINKSVKPFRRIQIGDVDANEHITATIAIDKRLKGKFTRASRLAQGLTMVRRGVFELSGTPLEVKQKLRGLVYKYNPKINQTQTNRVRFTLTITDSSGASVMNNTTTVSLRI